jgi:hypothetical protein
VVLRFEQVADLSKVNGLVQNQNGGARFFVVDVDLAIHDEHDLVGHDSHGEQTQMVFTRIIQLIL